MPRLNAEEQNEVYEALGRIENDLIDVFQFVEDNGPKGMARKLERALELIEKVKADLDK